MGQAPTHPEVVNVVPMDLPPVVPMEARLVAELPGEPGWQYEPKWDGFRAIIARHGEDVEIWSKSGKPLGRYFPEIVGRVQRLDEDVIILDGELVVPVGEGLSFEALQARLHPAASRIAKLSRQTPAQLILFDCLRIGRTDYGARALRERRAALEALSSRICDPSLLLSPMSLDRRQAERWLELSGGALDGVIAKPVDDPYLQGVRAMAKVKQVRSADCVVGGYRLTADGGVASLLLGLYEDAGKLDLVGFCSGFSRDQRFTLAAQVEPLRGGPGFTGGAPGGPSRWSAGKSSDYVALEHELVVEVIYDQVTAGRFRHGTRFMRWRPDKAPRQCTSDQLIRELLPDEFLDLVARQGQGKAI